MKIRAEVLVAGAVALMLAACGGGDGADTPADGVTNHGSTESSAGLDIAGSVDDADLFVSRDYLQGEWCNSDGQTLTITGDTIRMEDQSGGVGEFPVDLVFVDGPGAALVSQTDDEFVIESEGAETTFTRGRC